MIDLFRSLSVLSSFISPSNLKMTSSSFSGALRNVIRSLFSVLLQTFQSTEPGGKLQISALNMKDFPRLVVDADTAFRSSS